jgi:hypothetical protein
VPPKSGCGATARATFSGCGVPVKIVNEDGLSGDVSRASEDKFARGEGGNERNPDKDIAAVAQFALGGRPSDEARAVVARLPGTVIVRRALAALHDNTDDEASSAAARDSKAATRVTLCNGIELNKKANFKANWQAKKRGHGEEALVHQEEVQPRGPPGWWDAQPPSVDGRRRGQLWGQMAGQQGGLLEQTSRPGHKEDVRPRGPPGWWDARPLSVDG